MLGINLQWSTGLLFNIDVGQSKTHALYLFIIYYLILYSCMINKIITVSILIQKCAFLLRFLLAFIIIFTHHLSYYSIQCLRKMVPNYEAKQIYIEYLNLMRHTQIKPLRGHTYIVVILWLSLISQFNKEL